MAMADTKNTNTTDNEQGLPGTKPGLDTASRALRHVARVTQMAGVIPELEKIAPARSTRQA
jgi:hypothetical protein